MYYKSAIPKNGKKAMKVIIIENRVKDFNRLQYILQKIDQYIEIIGPVSNVKSAVKILKSSIQYDMIFTEILIDNGRCFDIFDLIKPEVPIVFIAADGKHAVEAFKYNGIAYLEKPITKETISCALEKAKKIIAANKGYNDLLRNIEQSLTIHHYRERFLVNKKDIYIIIEVDEISHIISAKNNYVIAVLMNGKEHVLSGSLNELEHELNPMCFFRINRQCIVRLKAIKKIERSFQQKLVLTMMPINSRPLYVSKERVTPFKMTLNR